MSDLTLGAIVARLESVEARLDLHQMTTRQSQHATNLIEAAQASHGQPLDSEEHATFTIAREQYRRRYHPGADTVLVADEDDRGPSIWAVRGENRALVWPPA